MGSNCMLKKRVYPHSLCIARRLNRKTCDVDVGQNINHFCILHAERVARKLPSTADVRSKDEPCMWRLKENTNNERPNTIQIANGKNDYLLNKYMCFLGARGRKCSRNFLQSSVIAGSTPHSHSWHRCSNTGDHCKKLKISCFGINLRPIWMEAMRVARCENMPTENAFNTFPHRRLIRLRRKSSTFRELSCKAGLDCHIRDLSSVSFFMHRFIAWHLTHTQTHGEE